MCTLIVNLNEVLFLTNTAHTNEKGEIASKFTLSFLLLFF